MTPQDWKELGGALFLVITGGYAAWQARGAKKSADQANHNVSQNGGTSDPPTMPDRLGGLEKRLMARIDGVQNSADATHALMVEHLSDHAGSDLSR